MPHPASHMPHATEKQTHCNHLPLSSSKALQLQLLGDGGAPTRRGGRAEWWHPKEWRALMELMEIHPRKWSIIMGAAMLHHCTTWTETKEAKTKRKRLKLHRRTRRTLKGRQRQQRKGTAALQFEVSVGKSSEPCWEGQEEGAERTRELLGQPILGSLR